MPVDMTAAKRPSKAPTELDIADLVHFASILETVDTPKDTSRSLLPPLRHSTGRVQLQIRGTAASAMRLLRAATLRILLA